MRIRIKASLMTKGDPWAGSGNLDEEGFLREEGEGEEQ